MRESVPIYEVRPVRYNNSLLPVTVGWRLYKDKKRMGFRGELHDLLEEWGVGNNEWACGHPEEDGPQEGEIIKEELRKLFQYESPVWLDND